MKNMNAMMSSSKTDWETPDELFKKLDSVFGFYMDVCATKGNSKIPGHFISPEEDAFTVPWFGPVCWMNPPYGKPELPCRSGGECKKKMCIERGYHSYKYVPGIGDWVNRAAQQSEEHRMTLVSLLPARTDTGWFQTVFSKASLIAFLRGRWKFVGAMAGATFPSCVAVFSPEDLDDVVFEELSVLGNVVNPRNGGIFVYEGAL